MEINRNLSVIFIIGQLGVGGSEKQLFLLTRELVNRGWQVSIIDLNPSKENYWINRLECLGVHVYTLYNAKSQIKRIIEITTILKKEKPDIVHSWSFFTNIYAAMCGAFARISVRLGSERGNQEYSKHNYGRLKYFLNLIGLGGMVTNSESEASLLRLYKTKFSVRVIPNGVDEEGILSRAEARKILDFFDEDIVIAGIGSLTINKNFQYLIDVFSKLYHRYPNAKLLLIGDGPEKDNLVKKATDLLPISCHKFLGNIPDVYRFLKGIDILCISSLTEGMPNVVLEAGIAGIPVVANKVGTIPSLILNSLNGFIVNVGDESKFISNLAQLLDNKQLRIAMGAYWQTSTLENFSVRKMADGFTDYYFEMVNSTLHS